MKPNFAANFPERVQLPSAGLLRVELLAGLVVALALIPEAISFSIIAGVDPQVGLFASFTMAVAIAFTGGRPAMISAATGAMALVVVSLVADHGVEYLLAATILAGAIQITLGLLGVAKLMRFVPRSVMTGFVNALAILIFLAQIPHLTDGGAVVYALVAAGLAVIYLVPQADQGGAGAADRDRAADDRVRRRRDRRAQRWATRASCPTPCRSSASRRSPSRWRP